MHSRLRERLLLTPFMVACGLLLTPVVAMAQKAEPPVVPRPVPTRAVPTPMLTASCPVANTVSVTAGGENRSYCLRTSGFVVPRLVRTDMVGVPALRVDNVTALALLADVRFQSIWPALARVMGADGTGIRDAVLREAQQGYTNGVAARAAGNTLESVNSGQVRSVLDYALALSVAGQVDEAVLLVRRHLPDVNTRRRDFDTQYDWLSLKLREAQSLYNASRDDAALAVLDEVINNRNIRRDLRVNAMVNKAAMLAEMGQAALALSTIDAALEIFEDSGLQLAGSDRQFAWIRACALHQLGRETEADAALGPLRSAPEIVTDPGVLQPPTTGIALRAALCMGDDVWVARLAEQSPYMIDYYMILLQPGYRVANARLQPALDAARARLVGRPVMERFRVLPDIYGPALHNWSPARLTAVEAQPDSP